MKIKDKWFVSVQDFISTIEFGALDNVEGEEEENEEDLDGHEPVDLTRGEFETAIHASNILRDALREKIPNEVIIKTEFKAKGDNHKMDLVLCGMKKSQIVVGILEFKQWSKIEQDTKNGTFNANKFRDKIESYEFGKEGCPSHQLTNYRELIQKQMPDVTIQTALVFPNLIPGEAKEFINEVNSAGAHEIYTLNDLGKAAKNIAGWFDDGCDPAEISCTSGYNVPIQKIPEFVKNIDFETSTKFPTLPNKKRHGWAGSVRDFIRHCELNTLATKEVKTISTAEQRSIMFSCNFLAMELRKLAESKPEIMDSVCVIVEFGMILSAHRIDAVLAVCEDSTPESLKLMAIEMKAWSNEEMNKEDRMKFISPSEFDDEETDVPKNHTPAYIEYTVGGGNPRPSRHPVEQVRTYMQELESEYDEGVSGCAWLHNVPNKLSGIMRGLVKKDHVCTWSQGRNYKTIFQSHRGEVVPLLTRRQSYTGVGVPVPFGIGEQIEEWLPDSIAPFTKEAMDRICEENPQLSSYCINQAFDYSEHILDEKDGPLDDKQRKIATEIIDAYREVVDGSSTKTVFSIEGDAGTGKTFIALAVIGFVLKMLHDKGQAIRLKQLPRLVCCNNPASDAIAQNCRMDAGGEEVIEINPSFMINRQNFNANSQYFLANALETIYEGDAPPALLIFDESQLLAEYTDAQMVALGQHNHHTKFLTWLDKKDLRSHSGERKNLKSDVSVLTSLAPITVFFADPKQATRVKAIKNITRKNLKLHCTAEGYRYVGRELEKSYRSEEAYLALLRDVLYGSIEKSPEPEGGFALSIVGTEKEFVGQFQNRMNSSASCGMVAGYTKEWKSSGAKTAHELDKSNVDWTIAGEDFHWNLSPGRTWIFSGEERQRQIGYFLAIQGNELDELFVYIGEDLVWDMKENKVLAQIDKHEAKSECRDVTDAKDDDIMQCIINQYWVLLTRAKKSCTVYCADESLRDIMKKKSKDYGYSS